MIITICSSANFYGHVIELKQQLEAQGYTVLVPHNALEMERRNDFEVSHYKTWFANPEDYTKKAELMNRHFDEIAKGDAVLIVNDEKHGVANYIGGNVLMEMAVAFYLKKKIFILNNLPNDSPYEEELKGMLPVCLDGDLAVIT